ncbi:hypothetical protein FEF26_05450 [Nesterenkonia salmonea]|uniref:Integral membrane protein n=1 Tax=Nesterenkonia salmonea TaxID=1804987 RepID=A0A5R9BDB5_9MICC|nr:DUF6350 family protein [Nesterenkonia salmonea]TLP98241.1 hypothetical protein FEF26_05450 [Nesterenkonia salmonea]
MRKLPPPPLWLFGLFEAIQAVLATALLVAVPVLGVGLVRSWGDFDPQATAEVAAQAWLVIHAVPLNLAENADSGWFHLVPLGFTLVPFMLSWRAGRRLAQGAYPVQLWQGLSIFALTYAAAAVGIARFGVDDPGTLVWAGVAAAVLTGLGSLAGCYVEARSATRMIGVDLESWVEDFSQRLKWAGAYAWAVVRGGMVAAATAVGLSALLLAGWVGWRWMDVANAYQELDAGISGGAGLTLLHLGLAPNLVLWALAYSTGAGFNLGSGSPVGPFETELGMVPAVPLLAALPDQVYEYSLATLCLPVLAGVVAGWWLMREGENHFDDWCQLKLKLRPLSLAVSTVTLAAITGAVAGLLLIGPLWLSHISLGMGQLNDVGPHAALTAGLLAAWVAAGTVVGYLAAPAARLLVPRRRSEDHDDAEEDSFSAEAK